MSHDNAAETTNFVHSTADTRTTNNVMRHEYRVLTDTEKVMMQSIKDAGEQFLKIVLTLDQPHRQATREYALARTKIEEAVMWAVKGLTK